VTDDSLPPLNQDTYVKESALALWENLPRILLQGFLFSLACLPALALGLVFDLAGPAILLGILLAGPAWTALNEAIAQTVMREPYPVVRFFKAMGHSYLRSLLLSALLALPIFSLARDLPLLAESPVETFTWVRLGTAVAGGVFLLALDVYAFPILALYDVSVRLALRNSLVLAIKYASHTLGLLAMAGLLAWLAFRVSAFLLVVLPAAWLVFAVNNCRMVVDLEYDKGGKGNAGPPPA